MAKTYTVKQGDNLNNLAKRFYGDPRFLSVLVNQNRGSTVIRPGDILDIPDLSGYQKQLKAQGRKHNISQGQWAGIKADEARYRGGTTAPTVTGPDFPDTGYYEGGGGTTTTTTTTTRPGVTPPPVVDRPTNRRFQQGASGAQYGYSAGTQTTQQRTPVADRPRVEPAAGRRRFQTGALGARYGTEKPTYPRLPVGEATKDAAPTLRQTFNPYVSSQGQSPGQIALGIEEELNRKKPSGTYQVQRGYQYTVADEFGNPDYTHRYNTGPYIDVGRAHGGKNSFDIIPNQKYDPYNYMPSYLRYDPRYPHGDPRRKMIGGGEGYPDLTMPPPAPGLITQLAQASYGGGGYGGGGYGGYGSYPDYSPAIRAQRLPGPPQVGPGRLPGRYGGGGGGGGGVMPMRLPGSGSARQSGITNLVSWTL